MELLSVRPYVSVGLANHDRIQPYHANLFVVLVYSVIDPSLHNDESSVNRLIAIPTAFHRLFPPRSDNL